MLNNSQTVVDTATHFILLLNSTETWVSLARDSAFLVLDYKNGIRDAIACMDKGN